MATGSGTPLLTESRTAVRRKSAGASSNGRILTAGRCRVEFAAFA
jgi:hypothetical protein